MTGRDEPDTSTGRQHDVAPLGGATAPADDEDSGGAASTDPADGAAGPTWPPAETEPDAHRS